MVITQIGHHGPYVVSAVEMGHKQESGNVPTPYHVLEGRIVQKLDYLKRFKIASIQSSVQLMVIGHHGHFGPNVTEHVETDFNAAIDPVPTQPQLLEGKIA